MRVINLLFIFISSFSLLQAQSLEELEFGTDSTFDVVTWNIEFFPKNGLATTDYVADIIEAMDADIYAIQEIEDELLFDLMISNLEDYNGYLESISFLGLAYIYKPDIIRVNYLYEIYTSPQYFNYFPRPPLVMDIFYKDQRFILINNHYKCCGDGILDLNDTGDQETRRYFANNLLKEYIDENVILLGDLNDDITDFASNNVFQMFLDENDQYLFTDMEIAEGDFSFWSYPSWPSHLDHILITNELFDDFENPNSEIKTILIEDFLPGGWSEYEYNVSDHRPVALKLDLQETVSNVNDVDAKAIFDIAPNPFKTEINFTFNGFNNLSLEIFNIEGKKLNSYQIPSGQKTMSLNLASYHEGIYVARLISNNKLISVRRFVK